jgi:hypothetical protein
MNKLITAILRLLKPSKSHDCEMYIIYRKDIDTKRKHITTWAQCAVCAERIG